MYTIIIFFKVGHIMFKKYLKIIFAVISFFLSFLAFFSATWYFKIYGNIGFQSIVFTLLTPMEGTANGIVYNWLLLGLLPALICTAVLTFFFIFIPKKEAAFFKKRFKNTLAILLCITLWTHSIMITGIPKYLLGQFASTNIYEEYYVSPDDVKITFPKEKRNLIYIFLESMETTYFAESQGGALNENIIPELYALAKNNLNFSRDNNVGGWGKITGTTWTAAAMIAQTSGVPLNLPFKYNIPKENSSFLPKIKTINNILAQNGYSQTLLLGSKSSYGGRGPYFSQHEVTNIIDYKTVQENNKIPDDYFVWWGYEDTKLFDFAKEELLKISAQEKPFAFSMLTADTHHIAGYPCDNCGDEYDQQYMNVIACASRQADEFVDWIKAQDFYQNTTVIIVGDHLSMDAKFFAKNTKKGYERQVYNCIINSVANTNNTKNREFTPMDMLPTTLASIGCEIEGERLGLGTNLFSNKKTLAEELGVEKLNNELNKSSKFYVESFIE